MANTKSAKKAIRNQNTKRLHNLFWKRRISAAKKNLNNLLKDSKPNTDILKENYSTLQKIVDKAAKEKVIHKNKAGRIKSSYANKLTAHETTKPKPKTKQTKTSGKTKSKSKSS